MANARKVDMKSSIIYCVVFDYTPNKYKRKRKTKESVIDAVTTGHRSRLHHV